VAAAYFVLMEGSDEPADPLPVADGLRAELVLFNDPVELERHALE
jgi:hypothetical protein